MTDHSVDNSTTPEPDIKEVLHLGEQTQSRHHLRYLILGIVVLAVVVLIGMQWLGEEKRSIVRYKTAAVTQGDLTVIVSATGSLQPVKQVQVGSEVSGTIRSVEADFNQRVKKGDVLARLDTAQLAARVTQAEATLSLTKASVREAQATAKENHAKLLRSRELRKSGMCSQQDCDAAEAAYLRSEAALEKAKAQVVEARAVLDASRSSLDKATIRSPIDGIVLNRNVEPGQTVAASFQTPVLFTLAENLTQMELHVAIDEADVGQVEKGMQAQFSVDAYPDQRFPAVITDVHFAPQTVEGVVTYETLLKVDNSGLLLRPGMTATAEIAIKTLNHILLVPNAALRFSPPRQTRSDSGGLVSSILPRRPRPEKQRTEINGNKMQQRVWILKDGEAQPVSVTIGASDGSNSEVVSGALENGMQVITDMSN